MVPVEKDRIEEWLKLIGCTPKPIQDAQAVWHLEFCYPSKTQPPHTMHVVSPAANPAAAVIASVTALAPEHLEGFSNLDDDAKSEFLWKLRHTLNRRDVDFRADGATGPLDCPKQFQISLTRYTDGLTLDSFARSLGAVYKTELGVVWLIQEHLGNSSPGPGQRFDFKKLGY